MVYIGRLKKEKMTFWNTIRILGLFICICIGLYILYYVEYRTHKEGMSNANIAPGQRALSEGGSDTSNKSQIMQIVAVPDKNGMSENSFGQADSSKIPKTIWTFWEGPESELVNQCIQSWKRYNPDYTVVVLNKKNYKKYRKLDQLLSRKK